jgi:hypothetical protein
VAARRKSGAARRVGFWPPRRGSSSGSASKRTGSLQPMIGWIPAVDAFSANSSAPKRFAVSVTPRAGIASAAASFTRAASGNAPSSSE